MPKKEFKIWSDIDWFLFFLILITFAVSFYFWPKLPQKVPTHWNAIGQVDGWGPKEINLFLFPAINLVVLFLMVFIPRIDPLRKNYKDFSKEYTGLRALLVVFFTFLYSVAIYASFNVSSSIFGIVFPIGFGLFFIYIGTILPNFKKNWFAGIRTPWTLSSEKSWEKTHKLAGKLFIGAGSIAILGGVFFPIYILRVFVFVMILAGVVPVVYSYFIWKETNK